MVLQPRVRGPLFFHASPHHEAGPDPVRIAGIAGAILLNAGMLMLMLAAPGGPAAEPPPRKGIEAEWFEPRPVPTSPPPERVPVQRPVTPSPVAAASRTVARGPATAVPPVVDGGAIAADPAPPADGGVGDVAIAPDGPATGMRLAYAEASAPPYPREALRAGHQGTVVLQVLVDVDGRPLEATVASGSGYRQLDEAARRHVLRHWRFQPAMRDGRAVQAIGLVPIAFSLERG